MARDVARTTATLPFGADPEDEVGVDLASASSRVWLQLRHDPSFWTGAVVVGVLIVLAAGANVLAPYDPNLAIRGTGLTASGDPVGPSAEFWLGTDRLGRDYWSRLLRCDCQLDHHWHRRDHRFHYCRDCHRDRQCHCFDH